ncbi:MAG: RNA polymerase sigma factor [Gemmatimonadota bacterium]
MLDRTDPRSREEAWNAFVHRYSDLLLRASRSFGGDYDAAMDRYEHVLEALRADEFKRLRSYAAQGRSRFESWLVVVTRRLCLDHARGRYGRVRSGEAERVTEDRSARRRLADLAGVELREELLPAPRDSSPERRLRERELSDALDGALAALPPRDRLLLQLRFEEDLSVREPARVPDPGR